MCAMGRCIGFLRVPFGRRWGVWKCEPLEKVLTGKRSARGRAIGGTALVLALTASTALAAPFAGPERDGSRSVPAVSLVRQAQYVGGHAKLRSNLRWLVVASRPSYSSSVDYARQFSSLVAPCIVVQSQNGWYAVLAGILDMPKAELNLDNLKGVRLIPQDAYLSTGGNFHTIVWTGYGGGANHDVMDQRALQSTVARMQRALRDAGFYADAIDGLLGRKTVAAYRRYEKASGTGGRWGEGYLGSSELVAMEGFASRERTRIAEQRAREREQQRIAQAESERRRREALENEILIGEWRDVDEMRAGQAAGFGNGADFRDAQREGIGSQSLYAEFRASDFRDGRTFLKARGRGFGSPREYAAAKGKGWRDANERTTGLAEGFETGDDYRAARRGGFENSAQYDEAREKGFPTLSAMRRAETGGYRSMAAMDAARKGGFRSGAEYRDAKERGFETVADRDAASSAGFERAEPWRQARRAGFASKDESDAATALGFATADARDKAVALGFKTAADHDAASRANWRDAAELERGSRVGFKDGRAFRAAMAGGFAHADPYRRAAARGFTRQADVLEADRLGYRTARDMERGIEGGFAGGKEHAAAAALGFTNRADWVRAGEGGFPNARDLADADRGGYRNMAELKDGRDGGFEDAAALRAAKDAGFANAAQVARAATLGYRTADAMRAGDEGGFTNAKAYRAARKRGFTSRSDMMHAGAAGFTTARERDAAAARGFATLSALEAARADGFDRADDHRAYRASGFSSREAFLRGRERGHATLSAALEDAIGRLDHARDTADDALGDAELFVRRAPALSDLAEVVTTVGELRRAMDAETNRENWDAVETTLVSLDRGTARLLQSLSRDAGFAAFRAQRESERSAEATRRLVAARGRLEATRAATTAWISANLLHPGAEALMALDDEIQLALASEDADAMEAANETVRLTATEHAADLKLMIGQDGMDANPPDVAMDGTGPVGTKAGGAEHRAAIAVTDANRFLLEGSEDGVVALYSTRSEAPNVFTDLRGNVRFHDDRALACGVGVSAAGASGRHLRAVLREAGVATLEGIEPCTVRSLGDVDLVIARRSEFLITDTDVADRILLSIEDESRRWFKAVSMEAITAIAAAEATLLGEIEIDLAGGGRTGFGAVALRESGPFCAVTTQLDDHAAQLASQPVIHERMESEPTTATLDGAYRASQRGGCATIYASGTDLRTLVAALQRDGHQHEVLPFWIEEAAIAAARKARIEASLARERAIAASTRDGEARAAIAARRAEELARTLEARTAVLRKENGPQARELAERINAALNDMIANCAGCTARDGDGARGLFPTIARWHVERTHEDDWEVRDVTHEIVEYGDVDHEGRAIRAIVLHVSFDLASPGRGARTGECHVLGAAWDGEFARWRDPFVATCGGNDAEAWGRGYGLTSLWTAREETADVVRR